MLGRQIRRKLQIEKDIQSGQMLEKKEQSPQNHGDRKSQIKFYTLHVKKLIRAIMEFQLLEKQSILLQPIYLKKKISDIEKFRMKEKVMVDEKENSQLLKLLFLSIWRQITPFKEEIPKIIENINTFYEQKMKSKNYFINQFFHFVVNELQGRIRQIKNKIYSSRKKILFEEETEKQKKNKTNNVQLKDIEKDLRKTIYSNIELEKIQAITHYIEGLKIIDNVGLIFQKQWERNKRVKKDVEEYNKKYYKSKLKIRCRSHQNESKSKTKETKEIKEASFSIRSTKKTKQSQTPVKKQRKNKIILNPIKSNQKKLKIKKN